MRAKKRRLPALLVILGLAACGGGGGGGSDDTGADQGDDAGNQVPVASSLSLRADLAVPYIEQDLIASDPDGDSVTFELAAASSGTGYSQAYVNPESGRLYLTLIHGFSGTIKLPYRVTDGMVFSDEATVTVEVAAESIGDNELGRAEIDPRIYAGFEVIQYRGDLLGVPGQDPTLPASVDLSPFFPSPGNQGLQGSCVGWATAYALKSYQEGLEIGWPLNTRSHLFSPAFVYNQIKLWGCTSGSRIVDALDLIVSEGAATLATMPYDQFDCTTQPSNNARQEAPFFKGYRRVRVNSTSGIKAALVNGLPVVGGIVVYDQLQTLVGPNSVYNTATGVPTGGHAITIVGYDDNRYGGAFKVINSWGTGFGDGGYFWLPYAFAVQGILVEAWILEDAENGHDLDPGQPSEPPPSGDLPNLQVESWSASYDPKPRGSGTLEWSVINTGSGVVESGVKVKLVLSTNLQITSNDIVVVYDEIPFQMASGGGAQRSEADNNRIPFYFQDNVKPGTYYMALWVDDLDEVVETNETDNVSLQEGQTTILNTNPDLVVKSWYAEWNFFGDGALEYEVANDGAATAARSDWDISLVLSPDEFIGNGNEIFLFYEDATFSLDPGGSVFRRQHNTAPFNLYTTAFGGAVPAGVYFMALWVDDLNQVDESNELNNSSFSTGTVSIGLAGSQSIKAQASLSTDAVAGRSYNGKVLPSPSKLVRKVKISSTPDGGRRLQFLDTDSMLPEPGAATRVFSKVARASNGVIFPVTQRTSMPMADIHSN